MAPLAPSSDGDAETKPRMGVDAGQDWLLSQLSGPPPLPTVHYLPSVVIITRMMCEVNHAKNQIKNSATKSVAGNDTMLWMSGTDICASCSSPHTLSVSSMMEKSAISVPSAKYMQLVVNKRTMMKKDEMTKYCVTESHETITMLLNKCEVDQDRS